MSISKELKAYINKRYDEKVASINKEMETALKTATKTYVDDLQTKCNEIEKRFMDFAQTIRKELKEINATENCYFKYLADKTSYVYGAIYLPSKIADDVKIPYLEKISKLQSERELLLIKLSMKKELDDINLILKDFGIELY